MRNEETEGREIWSCFWKDNWEGSVPDGRGWWWRGGVCERDAHTREKQKQTQKQRENGTEKTRKEGRWRDFGEAMVRYNRVL